LVVCADCGIEEVDDTLDVGVARAVQSLRDVEQHSTRNAGHSRERLVVNIEGDGFFVRDRRERTVP
jgi:hypothetical protein